MMKTIMRSNGYQKMILSLALVLIAFSLASVPAYAATLTVVNADGAGEGFNDATTWTPTGNNPATTIGQARLNAFQYAADIWGGLLDSAVEIKIQAQWNPLTCSASGGVLGSAGPSTAHANFTGAPVGNTWYVHALANAIYGSDLNPAVNDINAQFNSAIDNNNACLNGTNWYYGYDGNAGGDIEFVTVVLHEIGHGLGFLSLVNLTTGEKMSGIDDAYMRFLEHHGATPSDYPSMTNAQRVTASISGNYEPPETPALHYSNLHWIGPQVMAGGTATLTSGMDGGHVQMYAPNPQEPGSSVSHFSTTLFPNQLMEPSYTGVNHNPQFDVDLLKEIGWPLIPTSVNLVSFTATATDDSILLDWVTASETDCAGFNVLRSPTGGDDFIQINTALIPSQGNGTSGVSYEFEDEDVAPGRTYYYKLEDVDYDGTTKLHGLASAAVALIDITLVFPADGAAISKSQPALFEWNGGSYEKFKLQFSTTPDFSKKVKTLPLRKKGKGFIQGTSYTPKRREWRLINRMGKKGQTVYWRVAGENEQGDQSTSAANGFNIIQ
jgi:hypothetical protein